MAAGIHRPVCSRAVLLTGVLLLLAAAGAAGEESAQEALLAGATREQLAARFGEALREVKVEPVRSLHERVREPAQGAGDPGAEPDNPYREQLRLQRSLEEGDVARVEYDLYRDRVYRVRWRLAERFERPLMAAAVAHLSARLGKPAYDQTVEAKLGSGKASLRRASWRRDGRALELRQLSPLGGGPLYLSLIDVAALDVLVAAKLTPLPQPETTPPWWKQPQRKPVLLTPLEREHLRRALDGLVAGAGW